jgi:hypothetical protein
MKFLKRIWRKFRGIFIKRPPSTEKIISEEKAVLERPLNTTEIFTQIDESENETEKATLISLIAKQKTAESIIEFVEQDGQSVTINKKGKKRLYELYELRAELQILEEKRAVLDYAESKILVADYPDTSAIEQRVEFLSNLLDNNKSDDKIELSRISISAFEKSFQQLEKLLTDKSTIRRHTTRENVKQKQEEIYKNQIKQKLSTLETFINQNKLAEAKTIINLLSNSIKPNLQKELVRLTKAKEKYREKELINFKSREEKLLKEQEEEVRKIKELQELKRNQEALEKKKLIEYQTDYSIQLEADKDNFSCNTILKHRKQNNLYDNLERGVALLKGDKELKQYIHSFGNMHIAKLKSAFQFLITPNNFSHSTEQIEIFDWGCGQGLGSIALIDQLKIYKSKNEQIDKITLIEPGQDALKRAALHASLALKSESKINPINKYIDSALNDKDLMNAKHSIKIHIFSNIIDVYEVDADLISELIISKMSGLNYIICVGPRFGDSKDRKMEYFANSFKYCKDFKIISNREDGQGWNHHKTWTRKEIILKINL